MNPSVLIDLQKILGDNEKVNEMMEEMKFDPFENTKNQVKSLFSHLQDEDIVEILKKYNNDMDAAFDELVERNSEIEENKKREMQLEEERRKKEIHTKYIETFVSNFQMFDKKEIEEAFKKNNNDPQLTSKHLYQMLKEREQKNEEAKKLKKEMEIQNMQGGFAEKFTELTKEEIIEVIEKQELDVEKISFELGKLQKQRIFDDLFINYNGSFSSEEIRNALEESNWSKNDATKTLQKIVKEREMEIQRQRELDIQKELEIQKQQELEKQKELEMQKQREEEQKREKEIELQRQQELEKQKELERQRLREVEIIKQKEIDEMCEKQKQKDLEFQQQIKDQQLKVEEFQRLIELQQEKQRELEKQLEVQKEENNKKELLLQQEKQKELEKQKEEQKNIEIPKLEYSENQMKELIEESKSKMIDVQKLLENQEIKEEEETKKNIEHMILEYSNPEIEIPIQENTQSECIITFVEQDDKIVATVDFKSQSSYSWIGFYNKEDKDPNYKSYNYLSNLKENKYIVDKPFLNGSYHFRVFLNKYITVGKSDDYISTRNDFVTMVRDEKNDKVINVSWQIGSVDPVVVGAYVTVHKKEEERANYYRRWNWIKTFDGVHTFKTPIHTGEYEARVYFNGKLQFKSDILKIEGI
eukprot:TRINITY_DN1398_c0_g1_i1.p1 TRINITY_DN1398_c0_g1~~TRINITY_DN1398_c0_g1_i1.p1  ORF type:complete len:644 (-),score=272.91 TRINITY_DN1398_c0_g1_i1:54-1985(-)